MNKNIMEYETVDVDDNDNSVIIIDQTRLPGKTEIIKLHTAQEIWDAIYLLKVRGAPAIGVAAAFGIYVLAKEIAGAESGAEEFYKKFQEQKDYLNSARPTAVNLSWALNRMDRVCRQAIDEGKKIDEVVENLGREAREIKAEDIRVCRAIGENGLSLVKPGDGILTHCNAGQARLMKFRPLMEVM